jgi:aspartate aminotransferase
LPSERIKNITESPTMKVAARAIRLKEKYNDLVDLSVGEPDFNTPEEIKQAAKAALDRNLTKYTLNQGIPELRKAIAHRFKVDYQLDYHIDNIIVSNGAKQCLYNIIQSIIGKGDQVIIPAPYYPSYPEMVKLAEGIPAIVPTSEMDNFKITPDTLQKYIMKNTVAIILCNPSNPTGMVYDRYELKDLLHELKNTGIYIISDEVYAKLVFENFDFASIASVSTQLKAQSIIISGVSKAYAMTGWRIGYAAGPPDIITAANKIQSHSTSNASTISQYASLAALTGSQEIIQEMRKTYEKRRNFIVESLKSIPGVTVAKPMGAFYVFPDIKTFFGKKYNSQTIENCDDLAVYLLEKARVSVVPGSAFGAPNHIRISYTSTEEKLNNAIRRIKNALRLLE